MHNGTYALVGWCTRKGFCDHLVFVLIYDVSRMGRHHGTDPVMARPLQQFSNLPHHPDKCARTVLQPRQTSSVAVRGMSPAAEPRRNRQSFIEKSQQVSELCLVPTIKDLSARQSTSSLDDPCRIATGGVSFVNHEPQVPRRSHHDGTLSATDFHV